MFQRSTSKSSRRFSRCTFTTTSSPLYLARCTCASDAAASGVSSNSSKISSGRRPSERRITAFARRVGNGGTSFCSRASSAITSAGTTSTRVLSSWPHLMNVGPSWMSVSRSFSASRVRSRLAASVPELPANRRR